MKRLEWRCACNRILAVGNWHDGDVAQAVSRWTLWGSCPFCNRSVRRSLSLNGQILEQFTKSLAAITGGTVTMTLIAKQDCRVHPEKDWLVAMVRRMRLTNGRKYTVLKITRLLGKRGFAIDGKTVRAILDPETRKRVAYTLLDPPPWCHSMTDVRLRAWFGAPAWEKFQHAVREERPDSYLAGILSTRTDVARYCRRFLQGQVTLKVVPKRSMIVAKPGRMQDLCPLCHIRSCRRRSERCKMLFQSVKKYKFLQTGIERPKRHSRPK